MNRFALAILTLWLLTAGASVGWAQASQLEDIEAWQAEMNAQFADPEESPMTPEDVALFDGLEFFPINPSLRFQASFEPAMSLVSIAMPTSRGLVKHYDIYGTLTFAYAGATYMLNLYQSHTLRETEEYATYLFLPFMDATNGEVSYGGGRYLEFWIEDIQEDGTLILDFNKAYNPYCAYSDRYNCPVVPQANYLDFEVLAGVMAFDGH